MPDINLPLKKRISSSPKKNFVAKRPYNLGRRLVQHESKRLAVLGAARHQLAAQGFPELSMEGIAREARVTRQTVYNLFGTKTDLLEALFDQLAQEGGMGQMHGVMQESDPSRMLAAFVQVFCGFWSRDRMLLRRIHGIGAIDPEFAGVLAMRNQRRWMAATRIVSRLGLRDAERNVAMLHALTSFEFFDVLAEHCGEGQIQGLISETVQKALAPYS